MKNKITKGIMLALGIVVITTGIILGANIVNQEVDVEPPYAKLVIAGGAEVNGVNYVDRTKITVEIYANDDKSEDEEIQYYLSTSPISNTEKLEESKWKNYYRGATEELTLPSLTSTNTIYAIFRDKAGNTTTIYTGEDLEYTITYDANGGTGAPKPQTAYHGMSLYLSSERPTYEGKMFVGWNTDKNAREAMYYQNGYMPASMFTSSETDITLYAIWTEDEADLPLLADRVKVGDYVNYPVFYENVATVGTSSNIASLTGWRVLSVNEDIDGTPLPGAVNLVSAGVPMTYCRIPSFALENNIKNLTVSFVEIPVTLEENGTYRKNGFYLYETLSETFENKYTAIHDEGDVVSYTSLFKDGTTVVTYSGEKQYGDLKVRAMTKEDLDKIYDSTGKNIPTQSTVVTADKYGKMLSIPGNPRYFLASGWGWADLWIVNGGNVYSSNAMGNEFGVRPVVSLKPTVKTTGTDMAGRWNLEIAE